MMPSLRPGDIVERGGVRYRVAQDGSLVHVNEPTLAKRFSDPAVEQMTGGMAAAFARCGIEAKQ